MTKSKKVTVAVAQLAPVFLDTKATVEKACKAILAAGKKKTKLIVFPEAFVPGYPYWAMSLSPFSINSFNKKLFGEAVVIPDDSTKKLCESAKKAVCAVAIGIHEREGGTLYNTILFIGENGKITGKHRKLIPTSHERMIWGRGDGSDLTVFETSLGKMGGLICFEHANCLFKYALQGQGEQIHISLWPGGFDSISHKIDASVRSYAFEGSCFVLNATSVLTKSTLKALGKGGNDFTEGGGYSAIVGPNGKYIAGPETTKETVLYAEIDLSELATSKMIVDTAGHYTRPDVVSLNINSQKQQAIVKIKPVAE